MDNQRLRTLTTDRLHGETKYVYQDINHLTGLSKLTPNRISDAILAMEPWLRDKVTDDRFWDGKFDITHLGNYDIKPMTKNEKEKFKDRCCELPSLLGGKSG